MYLPLFNGSGKNNSSGQPMNNANFVQYQQQMPTQMHQEMPKAQQFQPYMFRNQQQMPTQVPPQFHTLQHPLHVQNMAQQQFRYPQQQAQQLPQQQALQLQLQLLNALQLQQQLPQLQQIQPVGQQQQLLLLQQQQKYAQQHLLQQQQQLQQQQHLQQQQQHLQQQHLQQQQVQQLQDQQQQQQQQHHHQQQQHQHQHQQQQVQQVQQVQHVQQQQQQQQPQLQAKQRNKKVSKLQEQLQQPIILTTQKSHDESNPDDHDLKKKRGRPKKLILDPTTNQYIDSQHPNFKQLNKLLKVSISRSSPSGNDGHGTINTSNLHGTPQLNEEEMNKLYEKPTYMRTLGDDAVQQLLQKKDRRGRPRKFPVEQTGVTIKGIRVNGTLKQRRKKEDEMFHSQLGRVVKRERGRPKKNQNDPVVNLSNQLKDGTDMSGMY